VLMWIAVAGVPGVKTHPAAESQEPADKSFANMSANYQPPPSYHRAPVNYPADDTQVAQAPVQYPVTKVQTYDPGLTDGGYGDTVDARGQLAYGVDQPNVEGYVVNQDPANYIGTFPEPVLESPYDYYYGRPYGYTQPVEVVILNNNRGFGHRNVMNHCSFPGNTVNAQQQNPRVIPGSQGRPVVNHPLPIVRGPSVPPRPRLNPGNNMVAPHRIASTQSARPAGPSRQPSRNP